MKRERVNVKGRPKKEAERERGKRKEGEKKMQ
jgi:hypothetical protein